MYLLLPGFWYELNDKIGIIKKLEQKPNSEGFRIYIIGARRPLKCKFK